MMHLRSVVRRAVYLGAVSLVSAEAASRSVALAEPATAATASAGARLAKGAAGTDRTYSKSSSGQADSQTDTQQQPGQPPAAALQEGTHFAVLRGDDGSPSKLAAVSAAMRQADVVLLGEYHDDAVAHALQLALLKHVASRLNYPVLTSGPPPAAAAASSPAAGSKQSAPTPTPPTQDQQPQQQSQQPQQQPVPTPARPLVLSLEMFETDVQPVVSEYVAGLISLKDLLRDARPWSNYMHDYHHLAEVCRQLQLPVVAANAPRRYVSLAGRRGSEALLGLPASARQYLPPLPHAPSSEAYTRKVQHNMQQAAAGMDAVRKEQQQQQQQQGPKVDQQVASQQQQGQEQQQQQPQGESDSQGCPYIGLKVSSNFLAAQSLWDATMAAAIARALQQHQPVGTDSEGSAQPMGAAGASAADADAQQQQRPTAAAVEAATGNSAAVTAAAAAATTSSDSSTQQGPLVVHVCGKFHCEHRLGIPEHLAAYAPDAKVLVVVFTPADKLSVTAEEAAAAGLVGAADYIVLTDSKLPRSFVVEHPV